MHKHKVIKWALVAFVVFFVATQPDQAAAAFRGLLNGVEQGFQAIIQFFGSVF